MKIAVLIAHANREPFATARFLTENRVVAVNASQGVDTFYVSGKKTSSFGMKFRDKIEKLRWTRFFFLLRIFDSITLRKFHKELAKLRLSGRDIHVQIPEDIRHLSPKLLATYNLLYEMGYDWVVRTTIFSVIRTKKLVNILEKLSLKEPIVGGKRVEQFDKSKFISGSFTVLNREAIRKVIQSKSKLKFGLIDDIAFSRLFEELGFQSIEIPSLNVISRHDFLSLSDDQVAEACQIRLRSSIKSNSDILMLDELFDHISAI